MACASIFVFDVQINGCEVQDRGKSVTLLSSEEARSITLLVTRPEIQVNTGTHTYAALLPCVDSWCHVKYKEMPTKSHSLFYTLIIPVSAIPWSPVSRIQTTIRISRKQESRVSDKSLWLQLEEEAEWLDEEQQELVEELKMEILEERKRQRELGFDRGEQVRSPHEAWPNEMRQIWIKYTRGVTIDKIDESFVFHDPSWSISLRQAIKQIGLY